jgi:hypothetical protein
MHSDLYVLTFSDETAALKALQALELRRNSPLLGLLNAIVVTRNRAGKVVVHQRWELPARPPDPSSKVPRALVEALFGQFPGPSRGCARRRRDGWRPGPVQGQDLPYHADPGGQSLPVAESKGWRRPGGCLTRMV